MTIISLILILVVIPAGLGFCLFVEGVDSSRNFSWRSLFRRLFQGRLEPGDFLIYRKSKVSHRPGRRAKNIQPAEHGDNYSYEVDKFWTVADVLDDGRLVAVTRTGKQVYLAPKDERLRKPRWFERMRHRRRFPSM